MKLRILGCSGGIGGNLRTTSMLLDSDVLIDAGTGVGDLSLRELALIDHVFVTHSHLDHITSIPLLVDSAGFMREKPLTIYATEATLEILKQHIFNWKIWPDFTQIPNPQHPYMRYHTIRVGEVVELETPRKRSKSANTSSTNTGIRKVTAFPANHVVPAVGFWLDSGKASLIFSGDTTTNNELWEVVNRVDNLRYLIIETAFSNAERDLAVLSKHLCPSMLAEELTKLKCSPKIYITHLKPGEVELTMREINDSVRDVIPEMLLNGQMFEF